MYYIIEGHHHDYETQTMIQVFCPNNRYLKVKEPPKDGLCILSKFYNGKCIAVIYESGEEVARACAYQENFFDNELDTEREEQRLVKMSIYDAFAKYKPFFQPWGILTGIRPAKIVYSLWRKGLNDDEVRKTLLKEYLITEEKAELCINVAKSEKEILNSSKNNTISLYIGIPFCPTRCLYCSFTSFPIIKYSKKISNYFEAMEKELSHLEQYSKKHIIESIYIGGGTPTSLSDEYLERLLLNVNKHFNLENLKEFTVEAGRPDTITKEKLKILRKYAVNRISINPQTMNDKTLQKIGRNHTVDDFLKAYSLAIGEGFSNINIDLILGLPDEGLTEVRNTFEKISEIMPNAVTVHTLAVKKASDLNRNLSDYNLVKQNEMKGMLEIASEYCKIMKVFPYYMYRQKNMIGNFENVGYSKKGYECVYNVQTMEERQPIIAIGAGAITKLVGGENDKINRIFNVKGIEEYILRIDEMINRKISAGIF